uniref:Nucleoside triphosphate pyrophosphohydrolase n=1 Tax=Myoviridae sp. ct44j18 TaxID=2827600 RepID=A0A8S5RSA0_9CAUD|nr:MAG TPA: nucleoside triphosphate pyrophosphohydrolase [Myoviridae sp. ct44j18]
MTKRETAICQLAMDVYGKASQCTICMEEMAELTKELSKNLRGQDNVAHIAEEIADVEIMLEQLKLMFSIRDEVTQQRTVKLQRLDNRISQTLMHPKP